MDEWESGSVIEMAWDRRRSPRYRQFRDHGIVSVRLRGQDARLIDLSKEGAVLNSSVRLLPGARLAIELTANGAAFRVTGSVVHASVVALDAERIEYRGGLEFSERLPVTFPVDRHEEVRARRARRRAGKNPAGHRSQGRG